MRPGDHEFAWSVVVFIITAVAWLALRPWKDRLHGGVTALRKAIAAVACFFGLALIVAIVPFLFGAAHTWLAGIPEKYIVIGMLVWGLFLTLSGISDGISAVVRELEGIREKLSKLDEVSQIRDSVYRIEKTQSQSVHFD